MNARFRRYGSLVVAAMSAVVAACTSPGPWGGGGFSHSPEDRARDLVSRMTADEKISQCMMDSPAIPRLHVPAYHWWSEALHGIAREGNATVFPQAIGLAATFDPALLHEVATVTSIEARAKHEEALRHNDHSIYKGLTLWSPNINIFRDPRWGRGQETYGEDPFLTSRMGVAFVTGIQGDDPNYLRCVATPKHFAVHSGPEPARHGFDALVSERDLHETYLPAFQACVSEGHAGSVMAAYSSFDGVPATGNPWLLTETLRNQWGFTGAVVSDVDSVHDIWHGHFDAPDAAAASAMAIKAGDDLCSGTTFKDLRAALDQHLVTEADIDKACIHLFTLRYRLGMFDSPAECKYQQIPITENDSPAHDELALQTAHKAIVLLKNDGVMPLKAAGLKRVAVIGPVRNDLNTLIGNYYGTPSHPVTILSGIRRKLEPLGVQVDSADGCAIVGGFREALQPFPEGTVFTDATRTTPGLHGEVFKGETFQGWPVAERTDANINLKWNDNEPLAGIPATHCSLRWTGVFVAPSTGKCTFGTLADDGCRLWMDGKLVLDNWQANSGPYAEATVELQAGKAYAIQLDHYQRIGRAVIRLGWKNPAISQLDAAVAVAQNADAIILTLGITPELEGEEMQVDADGFRGGDRTSVALPKSQQELLAKMAALGKPVVVVLTCGSCQSFDTTKPNAALVQWYSGQRGGDAVADVLFGDYNPAGRLPVTFYKTTADLPNFSDYAMIGRTYRYFAGEPLYPFGHGLSYSRFEYGTPALANGTPGTTVHAGDVLHLAVPLANVGPMAGEEVVQVYGRVMDSAVVQPLHSLVGFERVATEAGQTKLVFMDIPTQRLQYWDTKTKGYAIPTGRVELQIGASSGDIRQKVLVNILPK